MTYTRMADLYLGDVSSQVYEFLRTPRPCLFLNSHGVAWREDENYSHWRFGPVLDRADAVIAALDAARATHDAFAPAQAAGFAHTFDLQGSSSKRAAAAVMEHVTRRKPQFTAAPRSSAQWLPA